LWLPRFLNNGQRSSSHSEIIVLLSRCFFGVEGSLPGVDSINILRAHFAPIFLRQNYKASFWV